MVVNIGLPFFQLGKLLHHAIIHIRTVTDYFFLSLLGQTEGNFNIRISNNSSANCTWPLISNYYAGSMSANFSD